MVGWLAGWLVGWFQSTIKDNITAEGDFHKEVHCSKGQKGGNKTGRVEWESRELSEEFME